MGRSCRCGKPNLQHPVEPVLAERLAHVTDLHLGMGAVLIDDGVHASKSWYYRLDVTHGRGTTDQLRCEVSTDLNIRAPINHPLLRSLRGDLRDCLLSGGVPQWDVGLNRTLYRVLLGHTDIGHGCDLCACGHLPGKIDSLPACIDFGGFRLVSTAQVAAVNRRR